MVKADYKHDYYADLELTNTADNETIKKKFRELAKQYHPDRNPGREVEVVPRFQAIQAAHEILGDSVQKIKYDAERAKLNKPRECDSPLPTFRKPGPPRRTDSGYPNGTFPQPTTQPPPRRDPSATRYAPQNGARSRPHSATTSSADKFAQFARAAPQQWDRAKFEEASRAEGLRGMNAMRGGQFPQTSPLRPRHPTAPRSAGPDPYLSPNDPSPGFPGLGRMPNQRRDFPPHTPATEEPPARSAYAQYHHSERDRAPSAGSYPNADAQSQERSHDQMRPGFGRNSSKYASTGGERTHLNAANIGRSSSVRTSPIDRQWEERGSFGIHTSTEESTPKPRHRSHSPKARKDGTKFEYASESSSSSDEIPAPKERKKVPLRRPYTHHSAGAAGLTGYFPNTNYTRLVEENNTYHYPAPDAKGTPSRKPFANLAPLMDDIDTNTDEPAFRTSSQEDSPKDQYETPFISQPNGRPRNAWPFWAVPSSVCPKTIGGGGKNLTPFPEGYPPRAFATSPPRWPLRGRTYADKFSSANDFGEQSRKENPAFSAEEWHQNLPNHADMFNPPEPTSKDRRSPSKNFRTSRTGQARATNGRRDAVPGEVEPNVSGGTRYFDPAELLPKASVFQAGRLAPDFADKVNTSRRDSQPRAAEALPSEGVHVEADYNSGDRPTPDEMDIDSPSAPDTESTGSPVHVTVEEEHSPTSSHSHTSPRQNMYRHKSDPQTRTNGFDLNDLKQTGPFAPSDSGLKDLNDLSNTLPFQSRPAETLEALHRTRTSSLRDLDLPRAPKTPHCPADHELTQDIWHRYGDAMTAYMHDWAKFNAAMIEHFRARQEAVTHGMFRNWVCAVGDGATAEDFEASGGSDRAGFATYMTWLDDDRKCRTWWDVASEEHRHCMEGLGRVRRRVKELNTKGG